MISEITFSCNVLGPDILTGATWYFGMGRERLVAVDSFPELVQAHALASHFVFAAELERGGLIRFVGERKIGGSGRWVGECGGRATHAELVSHESATPGAHRHKSPSPPAIPALILSHVALRHCRMKIGENGTLQMNTKVLDNTHEHVTNLGPR